MYGSVMHLVWQCLYFLKVDAEKWIEITESFAPDMMQILTDSDTPKDCSMKRRTKAITRSKSLLTTCNKLINDSKVSYNILSSNISAILLVLRCLFLRVYFLLSGCVTHFLDRCRKFPVCNSFQPFKEVIISMTDSNSQKTYWRLLQQASLNVHVSKYTVKVHNSTLDPHSLYAPVTFTCSRKSIKFFTNL